MLTGPLPLYGLVILLANWAVALLLYVLSEIERNRRGGYRPRRYWRLYLLAALTVLPTAPLFCQLLRYGLAQ